MGMQEPDIRAGALDANQVTANVIHATKDLTDNIQNGVNRTAQTLQAWQDRDFKAREAHKARQHDEWKFKEQMKTEVENANANRNAQMAKAMSDNITSMQNVKTQESNHNWRTKFTANHPLNQFLATKGLTAKQAFKTNKYGQIIEINDVPVLKDNISSRYGDDLYSNGASHTQGDPNAPIRE